jgi:hypothetical protein
MSGGLGGADVVMADKSAADAVEKTTLKSKGKEKQQFKSPLIVEESTSSSDDDEDGYSPSAVSGITSPAPSAPPADAAQGPDAANPVPEGDDGVTPPPELRNDLLSMTQQQRLQRGLDAPVAEEWCLHCLRVLSSDATVVCRKVDYMARCDRCIKARKPGCLSVSALLSRCGVANVSQVQAELRHEAKVVQDAWSHFDRATGAKEAGWAEVMQARAHRFRLRSMALDRLKKRAPAVRTAVEAGVLIADRISDVEDSLREMVSVPYVSTSTHD